MRYGGSCIFNISKCIHMNTNRYVHIYIHINITYICICSVYIYDVYIYVYICVICYVERVGCIKTRNESSSNLSS